jgi:hypothetical protein
MRMSPMIGKSIAVGVMATQQGFKLPYSIDFSTLSDGAIPTNWVGSTFTISGGKLINAPTDGGTLIANGDMETGNPPTGYAAGSSAILASVADEHTGGAGTKSLSITNGAASSGYATKNIDIVIGDFLVMKAWAKYVNANSASMRMQGRSGSFATFAQSDDPTAAWAEYAITGAPTQTDIWARVGNNDSTLGRESRFDNIYVAKLTKSDLIAYYNHAFVNVGVVKAGLTTKWGQYCGVVGWWDKVNPFQSCLVARHNLKQAMLSKYVGATRTDLIPLTNITYSAGAVLEIRRPSGNTFQLWYNGAQIGTDQTVSDPEIINNQYFGLLDTWGGPQCLNFTLA